MTTEEKHEHWHLINLWNCTEPMTPEQIARLCELDALALGFEECVSGLPKGEASASEGRKYNDQAQRRRAADAEMQPEREPGVR